MQQELDPMVTYHWIITYKDGKVVQANTAYRTLALAKQAARISLKNRPELVSIVGHDPTGKTIVDISRGEDST